MFWCRCLCGSEVAPLVSLGRAHSARVTICCVFWENSLVNFGATICPSLLENLCWWFLFWGPPPVVLWVRPRYWGCENVLKMRLVAGFGPLGLLFGAWHKCQPISLVENNYSFGFGGGPPSCLLRTPLPFGGKKILSPKNVGVLCPPPFGAASGSEMLGPLVSHLETGGCFGRGTPQQCRLLAPIGKNLRGFVVLLEKRVCPPQKHIDGCVGRHKLLGKIYFGEGAKIGVGAKRTPLARGNSLGGQTKIDCAPQKEEIGILGKTPFGDIALKESLGAFGWTTFGVARALCLAPLGWPQKLANLGSLENGVPKPQVGPQSILPPSWQKKCVGPKCPKWWAWKTPVANKTCEMKPWGVAQ